MPLEETPGGSDRRFLARVHRGWRKLPSRFRRFRRALTPTRPANETWRPRPMGNRVLYWVFGAVILGGWLYYRVQVSLIDAVDVGNSAETALAVTQLRVDTVRNTLTVAAGLGGAAALVLSFRRQQHEEYHNTQQRITELRIQAVAQLGSENPTVRIGVLHNLERLGEQHEELRQIVLDEICSYLRLPYAAEADAENAPDQAEREVRLIAQEILHRRLKQDKDHHPVWEHDRINLKNSHLEGIDFSGCHLRNASFANAKFHGRTSFEAAHLSGDAIFDAASFAEVADFTSAVFDGIADFDLVEFDGEVRFESARFSRSASFLAAHFQKYSSFEQARFEGPAVFEKVNARSALLFDGARFEEPTKFLSLRGLVTCRATVFRKEVSFENARLADGSTFGGALFDEGARFQSVFFDGDPFFRESVFNGGANFEYSKFNLEKVYSAIADFKKARFQGTVTFRHASFEAPVDFSSTFFGGHAIFQGAAFKSEARFQRAVVDKFATFDKASFDTASFSGTAFRGGFSFLNAIFAGRAYFGGANFDTTRSLGQESGFKRATFKGGVSFSLASFIGRMSFEAATFQFPLNTEELPAGWRSSSKPDGEGYWSLHRVRPPRAPLSADKSPDPTKTL